MSHRTRSALCYLLLSGALTLQTGCVGYRVGSTLPPDVKSIYVKTFINKCNEPLIEIDTTTAAIEEFQKDGTLKIARQDEADVVLECTLRRITLTPLRYDRTDKAQPNEYRMTIYASLTLKRTQTHQTLGQFDDVKGEASFSYVGNMAGAKRGAIPDAAEDLAKRIVEKVVEVW